jgi:hypothetical protein
MRIQVLRVFRDVTLLTLGEQSPKFLRLIISSFSKVKESKKECCFTLKMKAI